MYTLMYNQYFNCDKTMLFTIYFNIILFKFNLMVKTKECWLRVFDYIYIYIYI